MFKKLRAKLDKETVDRKVHWESLSLQRSAFIGDEVIISDTAELCQCCKKKQAVILCDGCSIYLCIDCRKFDLWGYGCGHINTKVFCPKCFDDIEINPYSGKLAENDSICNRPLSGIK